MSREKRGTWLVIMSALLWGVSGVTVQYVFMKGYFTTGQVVALRMLLSGVLLLIYDVISKDSGVYRIFHSKRDVISLILFTVIGTAGVQYTFFAAVEAANSSTASILQYVYPIIVLFIVTRQQHRHPTGMEGFRICLAIIGTFFIATHGHMDSLAITGEALGWGLTSALCLALYTVFSKEMVAKWGTPVLNGWGMFLGGILIAVLSYKDWSSFQLTGMSSLCLGIIVIFGTLIPFGTFLKGVLYVGSITASALCSIEVLAILIWSMILFGQQVFLGDMIGMACIISAVVIPAIAERVERSLGKF